MGARGPAPKPTVLKILEGNPGKRPLNKSEPKPKYPSRCPAPPRDLPPVAKKEFKKLAPEMYKTGLLTEVDVPAFTELCRLYAYMREVDRKINEEGISGNYKIVTSTGYTQAHPYLKIRREYYEMWSKALAQFGLTPASRSRIVADGGKAQEQEEDPMANIIAGVF